MSAIKVTLLRKEFRAKQKEPGFRGSVQAIIRPTYTKVEAVRGISFQVEPGELLAFIGPNGAGKSTTIKMLTGILHPSCGEAQVLGMTPWIARQQLAHSIGSVFGQKSQLWYHLPPMDSFRLLSSIYELEHRVYKVRIDELIEMFELTELLKTPVRKLSLGQRMRCEIAASVLHRPKVLFLDEPTIGLDVVAKLKIREFIQRLNQEDGTTVFLTSHDASDIEHLCKRVMVVNHGDLILDVATSYLKHGYLSSKIIGIRLAEPTDSIQVAGAEIMKHTHKGVKIKVNTKLFPIDRVLIDVMQQAKVADINVSDLSMEEIIRDIYHQAPKAKIHGEEDIHDEAVG